MKDARMSALDQAFEKIYQKNIIKPVQDHIDLANQFNDEEYVSFTTELNRKRSYVEGISMPETQNNELQKKKLSRLNESMGKLKTAGIKQYADADSTKQWLRSIVSSLIDAVASDEQKRDFF